jgi:hypothetical protein
VRRLPFLENREFNAAVAGIDYAGFVMFVMAVAMFLFLLHFPQLFRARCARTSMPP